MLQSIFVVGLLLFYFVQNIR